MGDWEKEHSLCGMQQTIRENATQMYQVSCSGFFYEHTTMLP